jgi:hypothetical protein
MADSATPTSISTIPATIIPDASARASDSIIKRPIPRSAPMNSPTMTPISAKEIAGESEANTQAIVEGITTVRVICHSLAPSSRATLTKPSSIERAPSNVLKNTRNTTTIQDVTIFEVSARPPVGTDGLRELYDARDYTAMVKTVRNGMGLDLRVRVGLVNEGGLNNAPAWVSYPKPLPRFGTEAFKKTLVTVFLRKSFLAENDFESVVMVIAHELAHIVLFGIGHSLEEDEVAVDLTAMLLGYREFYLAG